jgi:hypothetical protein
MHCICLESPHSMKKIKKMKTIREKMLIFMGEKVHHQCMCLHTRTHTYTHTHARTHTHTHTHTPLHVLRVVAFQLDVCPKWLHSVERYHIIILERNCMIILKIFYYVINTLAPNGCTL